MLQEECQKSVVIIIQIILSTARFNSSTYLLSVIWQFVCLFVWLVGAFFSLSLSLSLPLSPLFLPPSIFLIFSLSLFYLFLSLSQYNSLSLFLFFTLLCIFLFFFRINFLYFRHLTLICYSYINERDFECVLFDYFQQYVFLRKYVILFRFELKGMKSKIDRKSSRWKRSFLFTVVNTVKINSVKSNQIKSTQMIFETLNQKSIIPNFFLHIVN
jgi:hypothetical protein